MKLSKMSNNDVGNNIVHVKTPFRISFFGGGTDLPAYFSERRGAVLGTTINHSSYVVVNRLERLFNKKIKLSYSQLEFANAPENIEHPIVRCILEHYRNLWHDDFLDIHSFADMPSGSGIGSSSAFTVGLLTALYALNGMFRTQKQLAMEAIYVERTLLKEAGGWQDQIFPVFGGMNRIEFEGEDFEVCPVDIPPDTKAELQGSVLAFFTNSQRSSAKIQTRVFAKDNLEKKIQYLDAMYDLVQPAEQALVRNSDAVKAVQEFGKLLDESWRLKRSISTEISSTKIDECYEVAIRAGAYGGKLSGAGGGSGLIYFIAPPSTHIKIRQAMKAFQLHEVSIMMGLQRNRVLFAE
jgi:D-glycero-alpha-D-manno-heptose-7-phosphate kinase